MINIKITSTEDDEKISAKVDFEAFGNERVLIDEFTAMLDAIESKPRLSILFVMALANRVGDMEDD